MDQNEGLYHKIALSLIPKIGPVMARRLVSYVGSPEGVFRESTTRLLKIPNVGKHMVAAMHDRDIHRRVENELRFIERYEIRPLFYLDPGYPARLGNCEDAPVMLYVKGHLDIECYKVLSIVGTRKATHRGVDLCEKLVADLALNDPGLIIVSGLAYGIDICAHKAALKNSLTTVAVLGHGMDTIYPSVHRDVAAEIAKRGALVSEFSSQTPFMRSNFVSRNRIIAGLCDATVVVESGDKGGALITADIANSYHRDVFAFPGRVNDSRSKGCNQLIKNSKAILIEGAGDLEYVMGWEVNRQKQKVVQRRLFGELEEAARHIVDLLREKGELSIDEIGNCCGSPVSKISPLLLDLEFKGLVRSLPGNRYKLLMD
jgi:DNA processing protein